MVRTGCGSEYRGESDQYMQANGVHHRLISMAYLRSNGLVERQNRTMKAAIHKFLAHCPAGCWWEVLTDVAQAL